MTMDVSFPSTGRRRGRGRPRSSVAALLGWLCVASGASSCGDFPLREGGQGERCAALMTCFFDDESDAVAGSRFSLLRENEPLFEGAYGVEGSCWRDLDDDGLERDLFEDCEARCDGAFIELCQDTGASCGGECAERLAKEP